MQLKSGGTSSEDVFAMQKIAAVMTPRVVWLPKRNLYGYTSCKSRLLSLFWKPEKRKAIYRIRRLNLVSEGEDITVEIEGEAGPTEREQFESVQQSDNPAADATPTKTFEESDTCATPKKRKQQSGTKNC
ncbi:hypothetical protein HHI36_002429 [Cryptolaemus montrouzieri]|uniref:Uncharacterized protein n=1 Tax=Cryptolaemus montrouzieri TaxID=559131 RepID=A0ABD2PAF4_9CUCU